MSPPPADVGGLEIEGRKLLLMRVVVGTTFVGTNIALNFYNSWVLKEHKGKGAVGAGLHTMGPSIEGPNFNFPIFFTMWHMVAGALGCVVLMAINKPPTGYPSFSQFLEYKNIVLISICTALNLGCNNISLTMVSLFMNQLVKSTGPAPTMLFSVTLEKKIYGLGSYIAIITLILGTCVAVLSVTKSNAKSGDSAGGAQFLGISLVLMSTLASALKPVLQAIVMRGTADKPKLSAQVVLFYDSVITFCFMFIYWIASNERAGSIDYISQAGGEAFGICVGGALMAFTFNLATYYWIQLTSALTTIVTANGIKVLILIVSALAEKIASPVTWGGVFLVTLAICAYAYFGFEAKKHPPQRWYDFHTVAIIQGTSTESKKGPLLKEYSESTPLSGGDPAKASSCCWP